MSVRYNRIFIPNEIYFITFTILGWRHIFVDDKYCRLVYKWFDYTRANHRNKIHGYVIMPNHIHCLIYISDKSPKFPALIQNAKRFLAYEIVRLLKKDKSYNILNFFKENARIEFNAKHKVFTSGYDSLLIQTGRFFREKLNYIHNNPCQEKWHLAESPQDYKYSSAANYFLGKGYYNVEIIEF